MSDEHRIIGGTDEELAMQLHDLSMDNNPLNACAGRMLKEVLPAATRWVEDEKKRGSDDKAVIIMSSAIATVAASMLTRLLGPVIPSDVSDKFVNAIADAAKEILKQHKIASNRVLKNATGRTVDELYADFKKKQGIDEDQD
jgi:hypothetical protein